MGPRTALKRYDFVQAPVTLRWNVRYLNDGVVDEALVRLLLEYGGWNGLGADRSQGNGQFEVVEVKEIDPA